MTPSVRKTIRECFPKVPESEILEILMRCGRGLEHAKSAIAYDFILRCVAPDVNALETIVKLAQNNGGVFGEYMHRWKSWMETAKSYESLPGFEFVSPVLRNVANEVAKYQFNHVLSLATVLLWRTNLEWTGRGDLYIAPMRDGRFAITTNHDVRLEDWEGLDARDFVAASDAQARILSSVAECFPRLPEIDDL